MLAYQELGTEDYWLLLDWSTGGIQFHHFKSEIAALRAPNINYKPLEAKEKKLDGRIRIAATIGYSVRSFRKWLTAM